MSPQSERAGEIRSAVEDLREALTTQALEARLVRYEAQQARLRTRRILAVASIFSLIFVPVSAYVAINLHTIFIDECIQTPYLSPAKARACHYLFVGDRPIRPGPQLVNRVEPEEPTPHTHGPDGQMRPSPAARTPIPNHDH